MELMTIDVAYDELSKRFLIIAKHQSHEVKMVLSNSETAKLFKKLKMLESFFTK